MSYYKNIFSVCISLSLVIFVGCRQEIRFSHGNDNTEEKATKKHETINIQSIIDSTGIPYFNLANTNDFQLDTIPASKLLDEINYAIQHDKIATLNDTIYTNLRQMPKALRQRLLNTVESQQVAKISTPEWNGEIRKMYDSDKLSYEIGVDTVYYELTTKLVINVTNNITGKNVKKEITRENVRKMSDEKYEMFNLYGWSILNITSEKIEIEQTITKLDSDVGDDVLIAITQNSDMLLSNHNCIDSRDY